MFLRHNQYSISILFIILVLTLIPGKEVPDEELKNIDKMVHVLLFFTFTISAIIGLLKQHQFMLLNRHACKIGLFTAIVVGVVVEILQGTIVPNRAFDVFDMVANSVGVALGYGCYLLLKGKEDFHML